MMADKWIYWYDGERVTIKQNIDTNDFHILGCYPEIWALISKSTADRIIMNRNLTKHPCSIHLKYSKDLTGESWIVETWCNDTKKESITCEGYKSALVKFLQLKEVMT